MQLGTAQVLVKADTRRYEQDIDRAKGTIKKFGQTSVTYLNKASMSVKFFTRGVFSLKGMLIGLAGGYGLQKISSSFLDTAKSAERLNISLDTITKGKGKETFDALNKWAAKMPVNTEKAITSYKNLRAMGLEPTLKDMTTLVDTASALGGNADTLDGIAMAMGQMATKGKVSMEEMLQLAERGVPAFQILEKQMSLTKDQLGNIGQVGLDVNDVLKALMEGMAERYGGASKKFMESWAGMIESMKSTFFEFRRVIMESGPFTAMKEGLKSFLDYLATNQGQMDLGTWAQNTSVSIFEAFKFMTQSVDIFYTALRDAQGLFAGLIQGIQEIRLPHIEKSIENIKKQQTGWQSSFYSNKIKLQNAKLIYDLEKQRDAIKESIKYWDGVGTSSQEALRKVEVGFKKIERAIDFLKLKNSKITLFSGGSSLGGKGIGGGGSGNKGKEKTKTEIALEKQYQAELMNRARKMKDSWLLYDEGAKRATDAMLEMKDAGEETVEAWKNAFSGWANNFTQTLTDIAWRADVSFESIFRSYARMLSEMLIKKKIVEPSLAFFAGGESSSSGGLFEGFFSGITKMFGDSQSFDPLNMISFGNGGVINEHVVGVGMSSGKSYEFGENGSEVVLPNGTSPGDGSVTNINIYAVDSKSFEDMVFQNPGAVVTVVSQALTGNTGLRQTIKGVL